MEQRGPWKVKSSEVKYKNPWMEVREDQVIRPDGTDSIYGVIIPKPGSRILPIDTDGYVYLVDEFHYGYGAVTREAIAGGTEAGEEPLMTAQRELKEEVGMLAKEWVSLGMVAGLTTYMHHEENLFLARGLSFVDVKKDANEQMKLFKFSFDEVLAMVADGRIINAQTICLILKAAMYLGKL